MESAEEVVFELGGLAPVPSVKDFSVDIKPVVSMQAYTSDHRGSANYSQ